ncbi:lipoyl domain-containing protein [Gorillibacterium massiliense]|uniref:lipoyl domain-containing protein n=1 Tax=Gorillibacterium massiliense TaxID=1280390 RepID=UPI0004B1169A|nr:lipoyl domain-containing protein [Gorillibacterium massiliense]
MAIICAPELGRTMGKAKLNNWLKKQNEVVVRDEVLCELELDKVSIEVAADFNGIIDEIYVTEGQPVNPGDRLCRISPADGKEGASAR